MKQYTNHCTEEQTQIAYKLGAPIHIFECDNKISKEAFIETGRVVELEDNKLGDIPTTQQMIGWLREKGILIGFIPKFYDIYQPVIKHKYVDEYLKPCNIKSSELAAIDAALDYLEKGETK